MKKPAKKSKAKVAKATGTGIDFVHRPGNHQQAELGSGVLVFDLDGDGDEDVVLAGAADGSAVRLFRNQGGGRFRDDIEGRGHFRGDERVAVWKDYNARTQKDSRCTGSYEGQKRERIVKILGENPGSPGGYNNMVARPHRIETERLGRLGYLDIRRSAGVESYRKTYAEFHIKRLSLMFCRGTPNP